MASLALPSFVSWQWRSRFSSPLQQWEGGGINYHFARDNSMCEQTHGGRGEKHTRWTSGARLKWGCACPALANYILTKHLENQSKPGCQWTLSSTARCSDRCHLITFPPITSSDLLLNLSAVFEVAADGLLGKAHLHKTMHSCSGGDFAAWLIKDLFLR